MFLVAPKFFVLYSTAEEAEAATLPRLGRTEMAIYEVDEPVKVLSVFNKSKHDQKPLSKLMGFLIHYAHFNATNVIPWQAATKYFEFTSALLSVWVDKYSAYGVSLDYINKSFVLPQVLLDLVLLVRVNGSCLISSLTKQTGLDRKIVCNFGQACAPVMRVAYTKSTPKHPVALQWNYEGEKIYNE